jgi:hypothetical protein
MQHRERNSSPQRTAARGAPAVAWTALFFIAAGLAAPGPALTQEVHFKPGEDPPPALLLTPALPTACDVIGFQARTDGATNINACTAEWTHNGHPVLSIDPTNRIVSVTFVGPVPVACPLVWNPVNGVEGSLGRLDAGFWVFAMPPYGLQPFQVLNCPPVELCLRSCSAQGVLTWSCSAPTGYCTLEFTESLGGPWREAPFWQYRNLPYTGGAGSLDLSLAREFPPASAPEDVVSVGTVFFRLRYRAEAVDPYSVPTDNLVTVVNRSAASIYNFTLSIVGSEEQGQIPWLAPGCASEPLFFHLPARPTNPLPSSWGVCSGSYEQAGQTRGIYFLLSATDLQIIAGDQRYYLW